MTPPDAEKPNKIGTDGNKTKRARTAILISGRGSNMDALIRAAQNPLFPARIQIVIADRDEADGLRRAAAANIMTRVIAYKAFENRRSFEIAIDKVLRTENIELICLAGFMRLLTADFVALWENRMINIHPSLLPAFKGRDAQTRALHAGVRIAGCTVHFVNTEMDEGPIIAQAAVPVSPDDTADTLTKRILAAEHKLYPRALSLLAAGKIQLVDGRVVHDSAGIGSETLFSPFADHEQ